MEYISAGDIEKYAYCPLSWYLSKKEEDKALEEGVKKHRDFAEKVEEIQIGHEKIRKFESMIMYYSISASVIALLGIAFFYTSMLMGKVFISLAIFWILAAYYLLYSHEKYAVRWEPKVVDRIMVIAASAATIFSIFAVTFALPSNKIIGWILEISSLLWLIFATYLFYLVQRRELRYNKMRRELRLPDGEIIYVDNLERTPLLKSERYGIWGRPDILIKVGKDYIPIEVKTGRTPRGPLFSHIMQLTTYMLLVEENFAPPPYGLLNYENAVYRIDYDEDLKNLLLQKVREMRKAMKTGEVHRNHHRVGKCLHCSRRDICPERLA